MTEERIYEMELVKKEDPKVAVKTPFYQTDSTGGSVWVIKPGQTLQKHRHNNSDDIWIVLQGEGIFYPAPDEEVPFHKGQVIVSKKGECHGAKNTGTEDIIVTDSVGKQMDVKVIEKDNDDVRFRITGYKQGQTYTYKIIGIRRAGESKNSSVKGKITIPSSVGVVKVEDVDYDAEDREVEFEFASPVQWKNAKVVITSGKTSYVRRIVDKSRNDIEVSVKALKRGVTYKYTISGIRKKGATKYGTVTGTFKF